MGRPLDAGPYPYLWLDALTQKRQVRPAGSSTSAWWWRRRSMARASGKSSLGWTWVPVEDGALPPCTSAASLLWTSDKLAVRPKEMGRRAYRVRSCVVSVVLDAHQVSRRPRRHRRQSSWVGGASSPGNGLSAPTCHDRGPTCSLGWPQAKRRPSQWVASPMVDRRCAPVYQQPCGDPCPDEGTWPAAMRLGDKGDRSTPEPVPSCGWLSRRTYYDGLWSPL